MLVGLMLAFEMPPSPYPAIASSLWSPPLAEATFRTPFAVSPLCSIPERLRMGLPVKRRRALLAGNTIRE